MIPLTANAAIGWMLTYALHSSILLGGVWCVDRTLRLRPTWRDTLWKAAFVGALFSASLQTVVQASPTGEAYLLPTEVAVQVSPETVERALTNMDRPALAPIESAPGGLSEANIPAAKQSSRAVGGLTARGALTEPGLGERIAGTWSSLVQQTNLATLVWLWAVVAAALVLRVLIVQWRAVRAVRARVAVDDPELLSAVDDLRTAFAITRSVRVSVLAGLATPVALGRSEVVVPARALVQLSKAELHAALAHELAHLARFDPIWRVASALLGAVLFIQPLNAVARRRIAEVSEAMADAGAVRVTGTPIPLARCLTTVASWMTPTPHSAMAAMVPMAADRSELARRVERVLDGEALAVQPSRLQTSALIGAVLVIGFLSPRIGAQPDALSVSDPTHPLVEAVEPAADRSVSVRVDHEVASPTETAEREIGTASPEAIDTVVQHPSANQASGPALAERWSWALREGPRERIGDVWVVYRFPAPEQAGAQWAHKSRWGGASDGDALSQYLGDVDAPANHGYALVRIKPNRNGSFRVMEIAGQAAQLGDFDFMDHRVYWLGEVPAAQGVALLRRLMPEEDLEVSEGLVELIGMHDDPAVVPFLLSVLNGDNEDWLRAEAAESLELYAEPDVTRALEASAMRDPARLVRIEAAEALGVMGGDAARDALLRIIDGGPDDAVLEAVEGLAAIPGPETTEALGRLARESADPDVRREASEKLFDVDPDLARDILSGTSGVEASRTLRLEAVDALSERWVSASVVEANVDLLAEVAFNDGDEGVRRAAVEALASYGAAAEVALLRIAFDHPNRRVARQAAESLGELPADVAVDALVRLTRESESEAVVAQAVEALGEFEGDRVRGVLAEIADSHRFRSAREEARDQLFGR